MPDARARTSFLILLGPGHSVYKAVSSPGVNPHPWLPCGSATITSLSSMLWHYSLHGLVSPTDKILASSTL